MDEPFGAVDPIVRARLQDELLDLQRRLRKTIVFVTHDIDEAIKLGDRIAVLNVGGVLEQYGPPVDVLGRPANEFVSRVPRRRARPQAAAVADRDVRSSRRPVGPATATADDARRVMAEHGTDWVEQYVVVEAAAALLTVALPFEHTTMARRRPPSCGRHCEREHE